MKKRVIGLRVLPGEPTDGKGRICIHLFVPDEKGPFVEPSVTQFEVIEGGGKRQTVKPTRGRLACDPTRLVAPVERNGVTNITMRTDDPRAATCPLCLKSADYQRLMQIINRNTGA